MYRGTVTAACNMLGTTCIPSLDCWEDRMRSQGREIEMGLACEVSIKRGGLRQGRYGGGDRSREQTNIDSRTTRA